LGRDFADCLPVEIPGRQQASGRIRQAVQRPFDEGGLLLPGASVPNVVGRRNLSGRPFMRLGGTSKMAAADVAGDPEKPGFGFVRVLLFVPAAPCFGQCFLRQVLRRVGIPGQRPAEPHDLRAAAKKIFGHFAVFANLRHISCPKRDSNV